MGVAGRAVDDDLEPQHADTGDEQIEVCRFQQHHGVGEHASPTCGERAVAGALLFDDGEHGEITVDDRRFETEDRAERQPTHREAGFHVAAAASVHPSVATHRLERWGAPAGDLARRHDIDVPVEQQRSATPGGKSGEHVVAAFVGQLRYAGGRVVTDVERHRNTLDLEPDIAEAVGENGQGRLLTTDGRVGTNQVLEEDEGPLRLRIDVHVEPFEVFHKW